MKFMMAKPPEKNLPIIREPLLETRKNLEALAAEGDLYSIREASARAIYVHDERPYLGGAGIPADLQVKLALRTCAICREIVKKSDRPGNLASGAVMGATIFGISVGVMGPIGYVIGLLSAAAAGIGSSIASEASIKRKLRVAREISDCLSFVAAKDEILMTLDFPEIKKYADARI